MRMISIAIVLGLLAFDDRLLLAIGLNGCELRLVTDSPSGLRACHAREIRAKVSFRQVSR